MQQEHDLFYLQLLILHYSTSRTFNLLFSRFSRISRSLKRLLACLVALTQTAKKTREHKAAVIKQVREAIDAHDDLYLFSYENMRSSNFKDVRSHFSDSRIFLGKNKLLQIALGKSVEDEYGDDLHKVSELTTGSVGLLLTSKPHQEVESYFHDLVEEDFCRAGAAAPCRVVITQEMVETHPVSMVEQFRKLGLPVEVKNGRVTLVGEKGEHVLAKEGETLSAETCKALVHFGVKLSEFRVELVCRWYSQDGSFEMLEQKR
jgi:mRNA turnover protein 4